MTRKRRILTSVVAIVLAAGLLFGLSAALFEAFAADSDTIKSELDQLEDKADEITDKKAELQAKIDNNQSQTKDVVERKSEIDQSIELTREEIDNTEAQIQEYNKLIAAKQEELDTLLAEEETRTEQYKLRLRAMEENGTKVSYWSILFKSTDFSDLLDRIDMIQEIEESDRTMLENMKKAAAKIAESREELAAEKVGLEEKKEELAQAQTTLDEQREEADKVLVELSDSLSDMKDDIEKYESMEDDLNDQIAAKEKEYQYAVTHPQPSASTGGNSGNSGGSTDNGGSSDNGDNGGTSTGFVYPLPAGCSYVSCAYGYRIHPITGNYSFHSGVDLAAAAGTPIYAAKSGTVTAATYTYVYGYYVTINHGDGYATLYGHMTNFIVSAGEYVSQGQVIGYVGSTGWSTGAHLHFTIYYNGATVNPMSYISVQ